MYLILNIGGNLKFGKSKLYDWQAKQTKCVIDDIYKGILLETPYILVQKPNSHHKLSWHGCGSTCETGSLLARETYLTCMMNGINFACHQNSVLTNFRASHHAQNC